MNSIRSKRYHNTLQLYNTTDYLHPNANLENFFTAVLIFLGLLIIPANSQSTTISTAVSIAPSVVTTATTTTVTPTPYPITNDTLTITELVLANSVIISDDTPINIPQDYRYIQS